MIMKVKFEVDVEFLDDNLDYTAEAENIENVFIKALCDEVACAGYEVIDFTTEMED